MNVTQNQSISVNRNTLNLSGQKDILSLLQQALFDAGFVIDEKQFPIETTTKELELTMFNGSAHDLTIFETPARIAELGFAIAADSYGYVLTEATKSHYALSMTTPLGEKALVGAVSFSSYAEALDLIKSLHRDGNTESWEIYLISREQSGPATPIIQ